MAIQKVTDGFTIVQKAGDTYEGNSANQTYSLNPDLITAGQTITIVDQGGSNKIELVGGLTITNSIVTSNETQFTLSNGAVVNVRGADTFTFAIGQNTAAGDTIGSNLTFSQFATQILGVTLPAAGAAAVTTTATTVINTDGSATVAGASIPVTGNLTAVNGVAEVFTYNITSTAAGVAVSTAGGDWTITGFNPTEDSIIFNDAGTFVTKASFLTDVTISASTINNKTDIMFDANSSNVANILTLGGVVDGSLSSINFSIV